MVVYMRGFGPLLYGGWNSSKMVSTYNFFLAIVRTALAWHYAPHNYPTSGRLRVHKSIGTHCEPAGPAHPPGGPSTSRSLVVSQRHPSGWMHHFYMPGGTQVKWLPPTQRIGKKYDLVVAHHSPGLPHFRLPCCPQLYTQGRGWRGSGILFQ